MRGWDTLGGKSEDGGGGADEEGWMMVVFVDMLGRFKFCFGSGAL